MTEKIGLDAPNFTAWMNAPYNGAGGAMSRYERATYDMACSVATGTEYGLFAPHLEKLMASNGGNLPAAVASISTAAAMFSLMSMYKFRYPSAKPPDEQFSKTTAAATKKTTTTRKKSTRKKSTKKKGKRKK